MKRKVLSESYHLRGRVQPSRAALSKRADIPISILIPTYRDVHLLAKSLPAFLEDSAQTTEILILNNDPGQDVPAWLHAELGITPGDRVHVVEMGSDAGFGRAVNRGIALSRGDFLLICNADLFPSPTYIDVMSDFFQAHPHAGLATGKILRYDIVADAPTDVIDTTGLVFGRNRRFLTRGEGHRDIGQFAEVEEIFGVDGAAVFARRAAFDSIYLDGEYFDESFFMYKDDWDLSWRVRLMGWECWYVPQALAFHGRTTKGLGDTGYLSAISAYHANEKAKPPLIRFHSLKNQWLMLIKNEDFGNLWRDFPFIFSRELMVLGYNLIFSPKTLLAVAEFGKLLPHTCAKRRRIKRRQAVTAHELRRWLYGPSAQTANEN